MVLRTRTVSCAEAVPIPDAIIVTAEIATHASVATLYLAFISSSHWLAVGMVPHCDPLSRSARQHSDPQGQVGASRVGSAISATGSAYPSVVSRFAAPQRTDRMCQRT